MLGFGNAGPRGGSGKEVRAPTAGAPSRRRAVGRKLRAAALLAGLVAPLPALADGDQSAEQAYRLKPGDRITVTVFGQPELSGEILIEDANTVDLPFIGPVSVKDMTVPECQKAIIARLADGVLVKPAVSVRISELRPIYVLGDVRTPGTYPFRYGSTVKSALAAAGGFGLTAVEQGTAVSEFLLADERLRELTHEQLALQVRRARLEAQRDGAATLQPPASPDSANANDFADAVVIETVTFNSQATVLKDQLDLVRSQKPRLENEIKAVNSQIAIEKQQVDIIRQQVDQYGGLLKQGLGLANADRQLKLDQTTRESDIWRLEAEVSRLQMDEGELDIKLQDVESTFRKQVISDLRDVQEKLAEVRISVEAARDVREARLQQAGSIGGLEVGHTITVTREQDGKPTVLPGQDGMALQPGDIVEIDKVLPLNASAIGAANRQAPLAPSKMGVTNSGSDNASATR
jgi:polysaccharide export outer membrane protein